MMPTPHSQRGRQTGALILVIVLIVFGAGKLPQLGEGLGKAIKGFKKSVHEPELIAEQQASPVPAGAPVQREAGKA